jgi:starch phosphorylase
LDVSMPKGDRAVLGEDLEVQATIQLGHLTDAEVTVDLCHGIMAQDSEKMLRRELTAMIPTGKSSDGDWTFRGTIPCEETGVYGYKIRVLPFHPYLFNPLSMGLVAWG